MRGALARAFVLAAVTSVLAGVCVGRTAPPPSPTPSPSPTPPSLPRFELATFQYALQTKGRIRVGTSEDSPPFSRKQGARFIGFDADVAREIARAIFGAAAAVDPDRFIEWVPVVSATRVSVLTDDKADVVVSAFTVTEERERLLDFSAVYFRTGQRILIKAADVSIGGIADLAGKTVCTVRGSPSERTIVAKAQDARILSIDDYGACADALAQGAADAVTADESVLFRLRRPDTRIVGGYLSDEPDAVGVKKGRVGFVAFINGLIADMIADGRWAALYKKHITPVSGDLKDGPHDRGRPAS